jgi:hypothetical protein
MCLLRGLGWLLVLASLPTLASCAVADTRLDDGFIPGEGGVDVGGDVHSDGGKDTNGSGTDTSTSGTDTRPGGTDTGTGGSDTKPSGDTGSSTDTSTGTDSGATCTVADVTMCASSTAMGSVSGDTGAGVKTATGSNGQWLKIDVTEDDSSIFSSKDLKVKITLDSPTGENFDLYVYEGKEKGDGGGIECTLVAGSSTLSSSSDVVSLGWADNHPVGGHDDSRTLSIEVRPAGEPCDPTATWSLKVEGNK